MNDPNKAINVNLSSLLSLKAELLRKQAEVNKAKATRTSSEEYTKNATAAAKKFGNKKDEPKEISRTADGSKVYEHEDSALLEKSKRVLEAKSKFYERMSRSGGTLNSDDNCLVLFNRKQQDEKPNTIDDTTTGKRQSTYSSSSDSETEEDAPINDFAENAEEDWVEYTDCLGRTRKCLRKDLETAKKRDAELAASMPERIDQTKAMWWLDNKKQEKPANEDSDSDEVIGPPVPTESIYSDGCSLMSKHDEQKLNWEKKEQENLDKTQVHYQDVFFDEARQHGVGYYAFSTDEAERKRQQEELENARQRTMDEQKRRDALRAQREKIIAERVLAAKNRQRARLGLPALTAEEYEKEKKINEPTESESKAERKARKRAEKEKRKQEADEAERQKQREVHVRPWDQEKEGVKRSVEHGSSTAGFVAGEPEWTYKPERVPLSQEEWNERKRAERNPDFAPVPEKEIKLKRRNFSNTHEEVPFYAVDDDIQMPPPPPPPPATLLQPCSNATHFQEKAFASFQTTKREKVFHRRSYEASKEECSDDRLGAAIPPPADLDAHYTLPPHAKKAKHNDDLERSIEAGLRFLRNNSDKGNMATKSSWTAKADYE